MVIRLCAFADEAGSGIDEQIKALGENGISLVEVRTVGGKNISKFTDDEAKKYADAFRKAGISVWSLGSPLCKVPVFFSGKKECEKARRLCELAKIFGTENIRAFSFVTGFLPGMEKTVFKKLRPVIDIVEGSGINFCHENDTSMFGGNIKGLRALLKEFPDLKTIYDPANYIVSGQNPDITLAEFSERAHYYHMKDASGKKVVPAGTGDAKIRELILSLNKDTVLSIEPHLFLYKDENCGFDLSTKRGKFDCAVSAVKSVLLECGYEDKGGYFEGN